MLWFSSFSTALNRSLSGKEAQETIFVGSLLTKFDLLPKTKAHDGKVSMGGDLLSIFQNKIQTESMAKLEQSSYKPVIVTEDDELVPKIRQANLHAPANQHDLIELSFNMDLSGSKFDRPMAIPEWCEFKCVFKEDNSFYIERLTSTGDPVLDMNLARFVKDTLSDYPKRTNGKIRVYILYPK